MGGHTAPVKFPTITVKFWSSNFWTAKRDFRENATPDYGFSASRKEKGSPDCSLPLVMKKKLQVIIPRITSIINAFFISGVLLS